MPTTETELKPRVTVGDVAQAANVSESTAYHVLRASPKPVKAETAEKVRKAAEKLGYQPLEQGTTLTAIAEHLGVSRTAATMAWLPGSKISDELRKRVLDHAEEIGFEYQPMPKKGRKGKRR